MCERGEGERLISSTRVVELLRNGEGLSVEFKRCSGRIEHDVFETIAPTSRDVCDFGRGVLNFRRRG